MSVVVGALVVVAIALIAAFAVRRHRSGEKAAVDAQQSAIEERDAAREEVAVERERRREAEASLIHARKLEAMGQLTAGIAHDFNNLLQAIAGNIELIARKPDDSDSVVRWSASALDATARARALTRQLLALSARRRSEPVPVRLSELIAGMRDMLDRAVAPLCQLQIGPIDPSLNVLVDPLQFELDLLDRAFAMHDPMSDGGTVALAVQRDGDQVILTLSNSIGSEPARMGIPVSSVEPRLERDDDTRQDSRVRLAGTTIVLVDDDPAVRAALADTLSATGAAVHQADDGLSGLKTVEQVNPDLLIVDFAMPGMSGAEVVRQAVNARPDLHALLVTGLADPGKTGPLAGHTTILHKPFESHELLRKVTELLRR